MKRFWFLFAVVVFISTTNLFSQLSLEVVWEKPSEEINDAKFSPDGKYVYCAIGKTIKKLDVQSGEFIMTFDNSLGKDIYKTMSMNISDDGRFIVTGNGGLVGIWDTQQNKLIKEPNVSATAATFYNNNTLLIISNDYPNERIILYDFKSDKFLDTIPFHFYMTHIQTSKDGTKFITGSVYKDSMGEGRCKVTLWDMATMKPIKEFEDVGGSFDGYWTIKISDNNHLIGTSTQINHITKIYNVETGEIIKTNNPGTSSNNFELLPFDYYLIYTASSDIIYGLDIYKSPDIYQSSIKRFGSRVITSKENSSGEGGNKFLVFQALFNGMALLRNSTGASTPNEPIKPFTVKVEREKITVNFDGAENIKIVDMMGNTLLNKSITESVISIPNIYPAGNYLCVINSHNNEYTQKFQVVR